MGKGVRRRSSGEWGGEEEEDHDDDDEEDKDLSSHCNINYLPGGEGEKACMRTAANTPGKEG